MEFIVDTATHRAAFGQKRLLFSWLSFYAGVGVALAVMLIAYNVAPRKVVAGLDQPDHANAVTHVEQRHDPAPAVEAIAATSTVTAAQVVTAIATASVVGESAALDHLRSRGTAPVTAVDREYATLAVMELSAKPRAEAERMVDAWLQMGKLLTR